jgi:hypothetical protein
MSVLYQTANEVKYRLPGKKGFQFVFFPSFFAAQHQEIKQGPQNPCLFMIMFALIAKPALTFL